MNPEINVVYPNEPLVNRDPNIISEKIIDARGGCCVLLIFLIVFIKG